MKRFLIPYNIGFDYSFALEFITKLLSCISCLSLSFCPMMLSLSFFLSHTYSVQRYSFSLSFSRLRVPKCCLPFQCSIFKDSLCLSIHIQVITVGQSLSSLCCAFILQLALFLTFSLSFLHSLSLSFIHSVAKLECNLVL